MTYKLSKRIFHVWAIFYTIHHSCDYQVAKGGESRSHVWETGFGARSCLLDAEVVWKRQRSIGEEGVGSEVPSARWRRRGRAREVSRWTHRQCTRRPRLGPLARAPRKVAPRRDPERLVRRAGSLGRPGRRGGGPRDSLVRPSRPSQARNHHERSVDAGGRSRGRRQAATSAEEEVHSSATPASLWFRSSPNYTHYDLDSAAVRSPRDWRDTSAWSHYMQDVPKRVVPRTTLLVDSKSRCVD